MIGALFRQRAWLPIVVVAAVFGLSLAVGLASAVGNLRHPAVDQAASFFFVVVLIALVVRFLAVMVRLLRRNEERPFSAWLNSLREGGPPFVASLIGSAAVCTFLVSISWIKSLLPQLVPFWADPPFAAIDDALFGGHPALPLKAVTVLVYAAWQAAHLGTIAFALQWRDGPKKNQAVIAFVMTWVIGMATAYAFSSAGPIFTGRFSDADPMTMTVARFLWHNYLAGTAALGGGISAFPSMHVAIASWIALVLRDRGRWTGLFGLVFVVLISMGAISLGWHYTSDIVGGVIVALVSWHLTHLWLDREHALPRSAPLTSAA